MTALHKRWGLPHVLELSSNNIGTSNRDSFFDTAVTQISRNINAGSVSRTLTGRYLAPIEKTRQVNNQVGFQTSDLITPMKSILVGMCPIKPISVNSTIVNPVQARCMWQIDYEIEFRQYSHHEFMFPTIHSADGATNLPPNIYWSVKPPVMNNPFNWDTTNTYQPEREEGALKSYYQTYFGCPKQDDIDEDLPTTVGGANFVDPASQTFTPSE